MRFSQKHVLITGGARGIGFEIARQFSGEGALVSLADIHDANLIKSAGELGDSSRVQWMAGDVSRRDDVERMVEAAEKFAPIDILINNAGIAAETPFLNIEEEEWRRIIDVNLTGMFLVGQSVCRRMAARGRGVVVNMGSKNSVDAEFGYAHYNASKGGIIMLTRTMAVELAHLGIRVNAVCPGYIQTPMSQEIDSPEFVKKFTDRYIPMSRPGKVHDVAPMFLFLAGEESSFITGQIFIVDGGQLAGQKPGQELLSKIRL